MGADGTRGRAATVQSGLTWPVVRLAEERGGNGWPKVPEWKRIHLRTRGGYGRSPKRGSLRCCTRGASRRRLEWLQAPACVVSGAHKTCRRTIRHGTAWAVGPSPDGSLVLAGGLEGSVARACGRRQAAKPRAANALNAVVLLFSTSACAGGATRTASWNRKYLLMPYTLRTRRCDAAEEAKRRHEQAAAAEQIPAPRSYRPLSRRLSDGGGKLRAVLQFEQKQFARAQSRDVARRFGAGEAQSGMGVVEREGKGREGGTRSSSSFPCASSRPRL